MTEELTLIVRNRRISGWTDIRVTRGIERLPSDFDIGMTELYPGDLNAVVVQPGDACQVLIGDDLVITGYVDRFIPSISATHHSIRITGRGKCQDIVDCAAIWPSFQISNASALSIAQNLAKPYGITVTTTTDVGAVIPQLNIPHGETVYEVIEQVCRYRALLAYDLPDGDLLLAKVGTTAHSSGAAQGQNVQSAQAIYSMDQRYSEYLVYLQSMDVFSDAGGGGNLKAKKTDPGVPRFRRKEIICEAPTGGQDISIKRANWEAARRMGRSMQLNVDVDSWRDSSGVLWTPNQLIPISLPILKTDDKQWIIGEVNFIRGDEGSYASLLLMPPDAFSPEPKLPPQTFLDVPAFSPAAQ